LIAVQAGAAKALMGVLRGRSLSAVLGDAALARLGVWERAALQDAAYGTLRHLGELRGCLRHLLRQPLDDPRLEALLIVALYQLQHSRIAPHAVVDHAVQCAQTLGAGRARGLVNAVLRNFLRSADATLIDAHGSEEGLYSYPAWWIRKLRSQQPEHWEPILKVGNEHPPFTLRVNRRRGTVQCYLRQMQLAGLVARQTGLDAVTLDRAVSVTELPGFGDGAVSVQDAGAQLAAPLLDACDGMRVLDACAAPGSKTAHLLELADLHLLALDCDRMRLNRVRENLTRLGLEADVVHGDAATPLQWWDGLPFDRILADVPCSASGVVRRHPDVKWLRRESDPEQFAARQRELADALWQTLARGGKFLYATCSVFREENQDQAESFLSRHQDARRQPVEGLPADGALLPNHDHDGFFYALFQKH
jgi:16S rRNA (cytosine967-C5)-methyltransferase